MWSGIACLVRHHQWSAEENRETQGWDLRCRRCGKERSTFPGDPHFRSHLRAAQDGQMGGVDGPAG